jgi:transposase InsO family protein
LPHERLAILWHRERYGMSLEATAKAFLVSDQTLANWIAEVEGEHPRLVQARRRVNTLPDLVREIGARLKREWPRWGTRRIAGILAGLGLKASRTSVQRMLRRPPPRPARSGRGTAGRPLVAGRPGQVWVMDFTTLKNLLSSVTVAAVLDAFSRKIVALRVCRGEPDAEFACGLLRGAIADHGRPAWVVTDKGTQFTSVRFGRMLRRKGIGRRFARVGDANLARIDRWWRAMKSEFGRGLFLWLPLRTIERKLRAYAQWHNVARPHGAHGGRAPDDIHFGRAAPHRRRLEAARLEVRLLEGERSLPLFRLRRAA